MKYYLYSKTEVLVETANLSQKLTFSSPIILESGQIVKVFPLKSGELPFCFEVGKENKNIKEIQFKTYKILEIIPTQLLSGEFFKSKTITNGLASVVGKPFRFNILINGKEFSKPLEEGLSNVEIKETKNCVVLSANQGENDYVVLFHKTAKNFVEISGSVDLSETKISAVQNKNTLAKHGELASYEITEKGIKTLSKEPVYLNKQPVITPPFLTHIAFFEAVRENDFNLAKTYLTGEFASNLSPQHFKTFFGDFVEIKPIKENGKVKTALLFKQSENIFTAKVFELEYFGGKISNIIDED